MEKIYKKVDNITFNLLSPKEIKKQAVAKVVTAELYDKEGYPVDGGLMDIRLGVIDPGLRCKTCNGKLKECFGHFGYIELARPIIHINYVKVLLNFLQCTCSECGRILLDDATADKYRQKMEKFDRAKNLSLFRKVAKLVKNNAKSVKKCPHCKAKQVTIKLEKPSSFFEDQKRLSPIEVRARMEKVPDKDVYLLGLKPESARPEWMVLTVLIIPPVTMRPSITLETGERAEDDLTHKLGDIVRINQRLFENINAGAPEIIVEDLWDLLQYHITTYFDNNISQIPPARHRSGQPLKTLTERIKSKEGRFRHNLAGKRVNYAARTVISPDPKIAFNEVGVPKEVAMELTLAVRVTEWNIEYLKSFVKNGPKVYPGANYVVYEDGKKKKISPETQEQILEEFRPGLIVERHLIDGDISIFNRQPSLHRMSIMSHRVVVLPGKSFRLNPAVCAPYNADFDGDEMNLHIPQTEEAQAEASILMDVQTQIISPKQGLNIIGCIDDSITGLYLLTKRMTMSKPEAIKLLLSIGVDKPERFKKFKDKVTGNEIFSAVLPEDFNFIGFTKSYKGEKIKGKKPQDIEGYVLIKNGEMKCGFIDKNLIGGGNGTLLRDIRRLYDEKTSVDLYGKIFRLGIAVLFKRGFTIKTQDADLADNVRSKVKSIVNDALEDVEQTIELFRKGKLKPFSSKTVEETLELMILQKLNEARNQIGNIIAKSDEGENSTLIMAHSGAKGKIVNLAQTAALVGQQALRGKRIEKGFKNRTLSLFKPNDLSPEARGFVRHSYKQGLNPVEFFFHAMTGRDSLMDTALRTPKSGYLYRRISNALQDLKVEYDFTVRDANKSIVQFKYGDDAIDVSKSDNGTIDVRKVISEVLGE
ncbi:DNA-directed RNA polymerase subunit A' [Candidatus Woesearchaeota archaeon]|nr:MAG: DNA-directed RNA polymerase subunit A' [Candidatus Woesearchaeota archaeon]